MAENSPYLEVCSRFILSADFFFFRNFSENNHTKAEGNWGVDMAYEPSPGRVSHHGLGRDMGYMGYT
jgi:hypothetical protein